MSTTKLNDRLSIPKRFLAKRNKLLTAIGSSVLWVSGWKVTGKIPDMKKLLVIIAPHTSNWDFVHGMALVLSLRVKVLVLKQ